MNSSPDPARRLFARATFALVLLASSVVSPTVNAQPACQFTLGFANFREAVGASIVGDCLEDARYDDVSGDATQATTGGTLHWRKHDNWTGFTNGMRTWVEGPDGVVQDRPIGERFAW